MLRLLREWDGRVAADSPAATVFEFFLTEMIARVVTAKAPGSAAANVAGALAPAMGRLEERYGTNPDAWACGEARPLRLNHALGIREPLGLVFNRGPFPFGGDSNTVAQAGTGAVNPAANPQATPSLRAIIDVGE